ncbi:MAG: hypothetical protein SGPRY_006772, partial [Prymnesium sp.]
YTGVCSALLSLVGACAICLLALRLRELSKRFFTSRLLLLLTLSNGLSSLLRIGGGLLNVVEISRGEELPLLCTAQARPS